MTGTKGQRPLLLATGRTGMALFKFSNFQQLWKTLQVHQEPAYGWVPDPFDERDEGYEFQTTQASKLSISSVNSIDNRKYFKEISSQWHMPSCTANAGADYLEAVDIHTRAKDGAKIEYARESQRDYSRMFLWWNGRNEMDPPRINDDTSGCYNRLIMDVAARFGVPEERYWPYDERRIAPLYRTRPCTRPSLVSYRMARGHTVEAYHGLQASGDALLQQIVQALKVTPGVLFGTALGTEFGGVRDKVLYRPSGSIVGRHAMVICGYDKQKAAFLVRNSHGKDFGMEGYLWMHESYIAWSKSRSFWVCTKGAM